MGITRVRGRWTPQDRDEELYRSVPFEVPPACPGVGIRLRYEKTSEAALDLGCADPDGWRGWSGSARTEVLLSTSAATPGYLAGPLPAGTWEVLLGLHRVPDAGVAYELEIDLGPVELPPPAAPPPVVERRPRRRLPALDGHDWLAGNLHAHSVHSDGTESVVGLACRARACGLDFLAVTDFNTVSHHAELPAAAAHSGVLMVPGEVVALDTGHVTVLGPGPWVDLRVPPVRWASDVRAGGRLLSANHPTKPDGAWLTVLGTELDLAEVWNGRWDGRSGDALAWWLAQGATAAPVGGADWHGAGGGLGLDSPVTWVATSGDDVLDGLAAGRTAVSADRDGPVALRVGDDVVVDGGAGLVLRSLGGGMQRVRRDREVIAVDGWPQLLCTDDGRTVAITR